MDILVLILPLCCAAYSLSLSTYPYFKMREFYFRQPYPDHEKHYIEKYI
jgi:hypothetical protein